MTNNSQPKEQVALRSMADRIEAFQNKTIPFHQLVSDLRTLANDLPQESEWRRNFDSAWLCLEEINALGLDAGEIGILSDHQDLASKTLHELYLLVKAAIRELDDQVK